MDVVEFIPQKFPMGDVPPGRVGRGEPGLTCDLFRRGPGHIDPAETPGRVRRVGITHADIREYAEHVARLQLPFLTVPRNISGPRQHQMQTHITSVKKGSAVQIADIPDGPRLERASRSERQIPHRIGLILFHERCSFCQFSKDNILRRAGVFNLRKNKISTKW